MQKIVKKHRSNESKHTHAWDDFGNHIAKDDAINDKRNYYFDKDKQVKLIFVLNKYGTLFWRALPNQTIRLKDGKEYKFSDIENRINESFEHRNFKGNIINKQYFYYKNNKVLLKNAEEELTINDTLLRADVHGYLLDGTPCIVEVIKTSDLSKKKLNYINENQILTFKIHIDDDGNQIREYDNIVGNRKIEQITESIRNGEGKLAELREANSEIRKATKEKSIKRIQKFDEWFEKRKNKFNREIERIKSECNAVKFGEGREIEVAEQRNESLRNRIEYRRNEINKLRTRVDEIEREVENTQRQIEYITRPKQNPVARCEEYKKSISRSRNELINLEKTFIEIAESCKIEWFRNKWMTAPIQDKISELKYWTS